MKFHDHIADSDLLERFISSGNQAAFAALVQRHGAMVHAVAMRVLANHHDAEDVTQATFIKLANEAGKLMGQSSVAGWLHTVSRHLSLNAHKSRESRQKREHSAMDTTITAAASDEETAIAFRRELDAALASLPEHYRQPLVLFHLEGAPLHDCAKLLKLNPVTLRTRLSRARYMLHGVLVRRGVGVASVAVLTSLLTAQAKGSALPASLVVSILDNASGVSTAVSSAVWKLANTTIRYKSTGIFNLILTPLIIMKTKTSATAIAAMTIAALFTTVYIAKKTNGSRSANRKLSSASSMASQTSATKTSDRKEIDPISKMSEGDFEYLLDSLKEISDDAEQIAFIRKKLHMDISDEVVRKFRAAVGYNGNYKILDYFTSIFETWLEEDPSAVMRWIERFDGDKRDYICDQVIDSWMRIDPTTALAWAEKNLDAEKLANARKKLTKIQQENADKYSINIIAEQIKSIKDPMAENLVLYQEQITRIKNAMSALVKDDPKAALDTYMSLDIKVRAEISWSEQRLYNAFAHKDPKDPAAAIASLISNKSKIDINNSKIDNNNLIESMQKIDMSSIMSNLHRIWSHKDPDAAIASAMSLSSEWDRSETLLAALPAWQVKYPEKNIEQAADLSILNEKHYNRLIGELVHQIAITDPAAAARYSMSVEDESMRNNLISWTARAWARKDAAEAERWVNTLPAGPVRDESFVHVAGHVCKTDMAHAQQLVNQIGDTQTKHRIINGILEAESSISRHFTGTLQLADQLPSIDMRELDRLIDNLDPKNADHFEIWLKDLNSKGRITYIYDNEPAKAYQELLDELKAIKQ